MIELLNFISAYIIETFKFLLIVNVIMSWLMQFGVINGYNPAVRTIWQGLNAVLEPFLRPIRNLLPNMGGLDISPLVLYFACIFIQVVVFPNLAKLFV